METMHVAEPLYTAPHILVVEDDPVVRSFCTRSLRINNYRVTVAENGRIALDLLRNTHYDLVLTDLQMPEMSGIALLQAMRHACIDTDVIVLTAYGTFETAREALRLGAFDYLSKPISLDDLDRAVRRAIEWRRAQQEKQRLSEIVALYQISQTFTSTLNIATAVREIVQLLWQRFAPQSLSLSLFHPEDAQLELLAQRGTTFDLPSGSRVAVEGHNEQAILHAHFDLIGAENEPPSESHLFCSTLRTADRPVGILRISRHIDQPRFGSDDRQMLTICASQIAASLDNSRLYQQLKEQNLQTISALAAAIDARDPYTHGHSEQVMRYSVRLAEILGLEPDRIERMRYGALLHDIGKIGIGDRVLLKPAPLNEEERAIMQQHPTIGADIVRKIKTLHDIIPIIEDHHERIDGEGYPHGVGKMQLCEEARILAIADAYDAMATERAYRKPMRPEQIYEILRAGRDTHWDTHFVDVFIDMMKHEGSSLLISHTQIPQRKEKLIRPMLATVGV